VEVERRYLESEPIARFTGGDWSSRNRRSPSILAYFECRWIDKSLCELTGSSSH
jgi:hypothetical protein